MLFFKDKETGKECLSLAENGCKNTYECVFSACENPVCTCGTIDIELYGIPDKTRRLAGIDLKKKTCTSAQ